MIDKVINTSKTVKLKKAWISFGVSKQVALGFCINKYFINLDIGPFWLTIEL